MQHPPLKKPPGYREPHHHHHTPRPGHPPRRPPPPLPMAFHSPPKARRSRSRSSCCRVFCWVFCIFLLLFIIVVALATGIFFLLFDPKLPKVYLRSFQIPMFNTTVKPAGTFLNAWTVPGMEMRNPNSKLEIYYSEWKMDVTVGDPDNVGLVLGTKELSGFSQKVANMTSVKFDFVVKDRQLNDAVASKLRSQYLSKVIRVGVNAKTKLGYVIRGKRIGTMEINVACGGGVTLKQMHDGSMPKCIINYFKWIDIL